MHDDRLSNVGGYRMLPVTPRIHDLKSIMMSIYMYIYYCICLCGLLKCSRDERESIVEYLEYLDYAALSDQLFFVISIHTVRE